MDPTKITQAADQTFQYGALGVIAFIFAVAIVWGVKIFLKREDRLDAEREGMIKERATWELQEAKIRGECEARIAATTAQHAKDLRDVQTEAHKREDEIRNQFETIMDNVQIEAGKSSQALVDMLQKFYERFVGPSRRY